ncbi:tetratricopeptide repeat protein, partial [Rhizobium phaseoli]|uniref:tetratricopeptide repeat protein n=1 Tax=Rhizobium phaseoli TaxID=396 RepID=UPI0014369423
DEAIRGLADALKENPQDAPVRAMLGSAYFAKDKYREAVNAFESLGERGKRDSSVGYAWAASLTRLGELQPASDVLQEFQAEVKQAPTLLLVGQ